MKAGTALVFEALPTAVNGAASLAKVVSKLRERGVSVEEVEDLLGGLPLEIRPLTSVQAYAIVHLRPATRAFRLSLGDRECLGLVVERGRAGLDLGVEVELTGGLTSDSMG